MNKLTQDQVSELSDKELSKKIASFFAFYYVGQGRCLTAGGDYIDLPDYCNSWDDLMPLVIEYTLKHELFNRDKHFLVRMVSRDNNFVATIRGKKEKRAYAECLYKVLQEKANNE